MPGLSSAYRTVEWFSITLAGFQGYIGHHIYLEMVSFIQLDIHSLLSKSGPRVSETVPKFCVSKRPAMRSVGDIALTPSFRKSKRQYYF